MFYRLSIRFNWSIASFKICVSLLIFCLIDLSIGVSGSLSCVQLFVAPCTATCLAFLSFILSRRLLELLSIESVIPSNHIVLCRPLLLLPSVFPISKVFSNGLTLCIKWPKNWSFSFSISPSNEYSGLISFRIDLFDLLAVQGTLKSLLQYHILQCSAVFFLSSSHTCT